MPRISDLNVDLLLTLDALLTEQNVTHAARRLGLSQPAMSARLARLHTLFGERLFIPSPHGRGVIPSPRAESLRPVVAGVLQGISALLAPGGFDPAQSQRTFVIAMHENPALMLGADLVNVVMAAAPGVRLRFALPEPDRLSSDMEKGNIDIYIGVSATAHPSWIGRQLLTDEFVTAQRKGHPRGKERLDIATFCAAPHLLVSSEGDPFTGFVDRALAAQGLQRNVVMSTQSYATAPPLVASTDLFCTLPARLLQRFTGSLDLFHPPVTLSPLAISLYWHPKNDGDAANRWLRKNILLAAGMNT